MLNALAESRTSQVNNLRSFGMPDEKLLDFVPGAVYVCDLDGVVVRYNRRAGELWGRYPTPGDPKELYCGSHKLYRANGDVMPHNETPMVDALREGNSYHNLEVQVEQPSGRKIWILVNIDPLRSESGDIVGVINCFQEITDRKLADERQTVLINELNHRVKNTLATIQAIAAHTFRNGGGEDASRWFDGRLMALSGAHDVLTRQQWDGAGFRDILREAIAPLFGHELQRFDLDGPDAHVPPKLALSLAIALHELCTNAAKYGALSSEKGTVSVTWQLAQENQQLMLQVNWAERDGPVVLPPAQRGFGSRVLERTLVREHDAQVKLEYLPAGLHCRITVPLSL